MTFDEIVKARVSVRSYEDRPVEDVKLNEVLEAGRLAPSANNGQEWKFTVVKNAQLRQKLMGACKNQKQVGQAPVDLVIWRTAGGIMDNDQDVASVDCSIALSFMILKAAELGLGTCWLAAFSAPDVKEVLGLPEGAAVVAVTPLGYAKTTPPAKPRKPLSELVDMRE